MFGTSAAVADTTASLHLGQPRVKCLCSAEKAGILFACHWLTDQVYPSLTPLLYPGALTVSHDMDKEYFVKKIESITGEKFEEV